jgi:hypothetical protein
VRVFSGDRVNVETLRIPERDIAEGYVIVLVIPTANIRVSTAKPNFFVTGRLLMILCRLGFGKTATSCGPVVDCSA